MILQNRLRKLMIHNKIQNIKVFRENIIKCNYVENDNRIDAILSFNDEQCFMGVELLTENNVQNLHVLHQHEVEGFSLDNSNIANCAYRMGTDSLISEHD